MDRFFRLRKLVSILLRLSLLLGLIVVGALLGAAAWQVLVAGGFFLGVVLLVPFVFSALSAIGWLFYCVHRSLRQLKWRIIGVGLLVVWACASGWFASQGDAWHNLSDRHLVNSILLLSAFALFVGALAFSMVGRVIFNQLRILFTFERNKNVFWGLSDRDLLLARSIVKANAYAQIQVNLNVELSYNAATKARMSDLADTMDAAWVFVDYSAPGKRCHLGCRHYLLSSDGHQNIAMANRIVNSFCADRKACTEKTLYVRAGDIDNDEMFSVWAQGVYERTGHLVRVVVLKEAEMIARQFVECYPPSALSGEALSIGPDATVTFRKKANKTLMLGFDHTGRAVLNANLCVSRFVSDGGKTPVAAPVTVVDMRPERWERFACAEPEIEAHKGEYGIEFVSHKVGSKEFEAWLRERRDEFCRIVFCLPDDAFNIREALRIRELLIEWNLATADKELLVRVADPAMNELESMRYDVLPLKFFGDLKDLYSVEFLDRDPVERVASVLNWQWSVNRNDYLDENATAKIKRRKDTAEQLKEQADDVRRLWEKASYYNRQASRASALGGLSFLRLLGVEWRLKEKGRMGVPDGMRRLAVEDLRKRVQKARDVLARTEHMRWMTYLFTQGIRTWDLLSPDTIENVAAKTQGAKASFIVPNSLARQTSAFRAHAALIPFDDLPELDAHLAHVVNPGECAGLTAADFEGTRQPDIGGGRHPSSLQGKDYDMWAVLPEAMDMAGVEFLERTQTRETMPESRSFCPDILCRIGAGANWIRKFYSWMTREPADKRTEAEREEALRKHFADAKIVDRVRRSAKWAQMVYNDDADLAGEVPAAKPYDGFLKASIVERCQMRLKRANKESVTAFMFDDAISRHFSWMRGGAWRQTRLPYFFNPKNGMILPLYLLPMSERKDYCEALGITARRVLFKRGFRDCLTFHRQPDFVAQVFSFVDETDQDRREKIAVAFRGTKTLTDWWEDVIQCFGLTPPQFRLAADLVRAVCETTDKDVVLVGHSEGGGEVQYALVKNSLRCWTGRREIQGVTINSQRLSPRLLDELRLDVDEAYALKHIINYRTGPDIVSGWKALGIDLIGTVYTLGKKGMFWGIKAHLIKEFMRVLERRLEEFSSINSKKNCEAEDGV